MLDEGNFTTYLRNSLIVALATVLVSGIVALLASVAVARFRFKFRTAVLVLILVVQMVPLEALVIPLFLQAKNLNLLNHLLGLVVVYVAFSLPFAIWTLRGFVAAVPVEIEEAAYVDGASWSRMFWSILLPARGAGPGRDERVLVHHRVERVHLRDHVHERRGPVHGRGRPAAVLHPVLDRLGLR